MRNVIKTESNKMCLTIKLVEKSIIITPENLFFNLLNKFLKGALKFCSYPYTYV